MGRAHTLIIVSGQGQPARGKALVGEIVRLARANDYRALLDIDADPETRVLLDGLPERQSRSAERHLDGARIWRSRQNDKARDKMEAATKALNELDLVLARGILRKVDSTVLDGPDMARYDELLLAVEARAMELKTIESELPTPPTDARRRRRRFWRR